MKLPIVSNPWTYSSISRILRVMAYSTKTLSRPSPSKSPDTLHTRVSRSGDPKSSVVPVLNQWLEEGKPMKQSTLQVIIRHLRSFRRYKHALEVSEYMSEEMKYNISVGDMAVKLDLISKVHGLDQAEKYFNSLPEAMKTFQVYGALLNCYANHECLEKAEDTFQIMRKSGLPIFAVSYNVMLNLYNHLGKHEKLDALMQEMTDKGIKHNAFTNNIRLNAYASSYDIEGMEKFLTRMENDAEISMDWNAYVIASNAYLKAKLTVKALQMLSRAEQLVPQSSRKHAYEVFLTIYTNLGRKEDVYRIWNLYRNLGKFFNSGYLCMISSLVKLDDLDGAEKVLAEWEIGCSFCDARIPNVMISAYCKKGYVEKAEAYTKRLIERGVIKEPDAFILNSLATGYQMDGQMAEAVETLKAAISCSNSRWKPNTGTLAACLKFLERENNLEAAKELLELFNVKGHLSIDAYDRLVRSIADGNVDVSSLGPIGDSETSDEESTI
ncbi:putative pentatricopeptide repeat-containing protein [Hibiscus syriacus]|uniref:Pentatricopeptide repeat-containing protein n=1 Tax=Hibiscus syriacus TaxID=106335 RepID=A0A6A3D8W5_HIBSY|nr:pentatricopeptide repeat-containing protein At2g20710, mitochondrial-like [Hibiscus syriacus]KAE8736388.1 putative pentatricopeptide repeat-containing protein [Hibiscus syriacus]